MEAVKGIWDNVVMPLVQPFVDSFKTGLALVKGDWDGVITGLKAVWDGTIGPLVSAFVDPFLNALSSIRERWSEMTETMRERFGFIDAIFTKLEEFKAKFDFIRDNWSLIIDAMKARFDKFIEPITDRLSGPVEKLREKMDVVKTRFGELRDNMVEFRDTVVGAFGDFIEPKFERLKELIDDIRAGYDDIKGFVGDTKDNILGRGEGGGGGFSAGGIASGPTSGYTATLHGTEAIVPLPNGRSIPVEMQGGAAGSQTFNITVNASGITDRSDKRQLAREIGNMLQQEVARAVGGSTTRGRF